MKLLVCLLAVVAVANAAAVVYTGTVRTYLINKFNAVRSNCSRGQERWANYTVDYDYMIQGQPSPWNKKYPKSTKMFQLKWDANLATAAAARLDSLNPSTHTMSAPLPNNVGEITHGVIYNIGPNTITPKEIFDKAWTGSWYGWFKDFGLPAMKYNTSTNDYQNFAYQLVAGNAKKIGCAYAKFTDSNKYATVCQFSPKGLAVGGKVYATGATCSACPANAPCNQAKGLCVVKPSAG